MKPFWSFCLGASLCLSACAADETSGSRATPTASVSSVTTRDAGSTDTSASTSEAGISRRCNAAASTRRDDGRARDAEAIAALPALETLRGPVSYYHDSLHGRRTASGDRYDKNALTAASRTLPFGTLVRIRRTDSPNHGVIVRVNDRGPFGRNGRILDLSRAAAQCLDMIRRGVAEVRAEVLEYGPRGRPAR